MSTSPWTSTRPLGKDIQLATPLDLHMLMGRSEASVNRILWEIGSDAHLEKREEV